MLLDVFQFIDLSNDLALLRAVCRVELGKDWLLELDTPPRAASVERILQGTR